MILPASIESRLENLRRANVVRAERAELKSRWRAIGRVAALPEAIKILAYDYDEPAWRRMRVDVLVDAIPHAGGRLIAKMHMRCQTRPTATIGSLTERQRTCVVEFLEAWRESWRVG